MAEKKATVGAEDQIPVVEEEVTEDTFVPETAEDSEDGGLPSLPGEDADSQEEDDTESEEEVEDSEETSDDDLEEESTDVEDLLEELDEPDDDKKSGVQKRIDRLTAEKKRLKEENEKLKEKAESEDIDVSDVFGERLPDYKDSDVNKALAKAVEDGDGALIAELVDYKVKKAQRDAVKRVRIQEKKKAQEIQRKQYEMQQEWFSIVDEYSILAKDDKAFDLTDKKSLLYRTADALLKDSSKKERYDKGGIRLAISDATRLIIKRKRGSVKKQADKQIAKNKRKMSVSSKGSAGAKKKSLPQPKGHSDKIKTFMEQKRELQKRAGIGV